MNRLREIWQKLGPGQKLRILNRCHDTESVAALLMRVYSDDLPMVTPDPLAAELRRTVALQAKDRLCEVLTLGEPGEDLLDVMRTEAREAERLMAVTPGALIDAVAEGGDCRRMIAAAEAVTAELKRLLAYSRAREA